MRVFDEYSRKMPEWLFNLEGNDISVDEYYNLVINGQSTGIRINMDKSLPEVLSDIRGYIHPSRLQIFSNMNKSEFIEYVCKEYKNLFGSAYDDGKAKSSAATIWSTSQGDKDPERAMTALNVVLAKMKARGRAMGYHSLGVIKENLFDAPDSVKKSFNEIVRYFAKSSESESCTVGLCIRSEIKEGKHGPNVTEKDIKHKKTFPNEDPLAINKWKSFMEKKDGVKYHLSWYEDYFRREFGQWILR
jgi:hypothetical protein